LQEFKINQNLDNKIFENIREGDWLIKYTIDRLNDSNGFKELVNNLNSNVLEYYLNIPLYLKPKYLTKFIEALNELLVKRLYSLIENKVNFFKLILLYFFRTILNLKENSIKIYL
jgi:hypothetical protein